MVGNKRLNAFATVSSLYTAPPEGGTDSRNEVKPGVSQRATRSMAMGRNEATTMRVHFGFKRHCETVLSTCVCWLGVGVEANVSRRRESITLRKVGSLLRVACKPRTAWGRSNVSGSYRSLRVGSSTECIGVSTSIVVERHNSHTHTQKKKKKTSSNLNLHIYKPQVSPSACPKKEYDFDSPHLKKKVRHFEQEHLVDYDRCLDHLNSTLIHRVLSEEKNSPDSIHIGVVLLYIFKSCINS